jgi:hypothetical protein
VDGELMAYRQIKASDAMPPGVTPVKGSVGQSNDFARADHTHKTSVQKERVVYSVPNATAVVTWVYPSPFPDGSKLPVCQATAECAADSTAGYFANVITGSVTLTQCQIKIWRVSGQAPGLTVASLVSAVGGMFGLAPAGVALNLNASLPTIAPT